MSLKEREIARGKREASEYERLIPSPRSKIWFWLVVVVVVAAAIRFYFPPR